jgi:DNA repair protein RadD
VSFILRPYQIEAVDAALLAIKKRHNGILVLPTGSGKSFIISELTYKANTKTIILQPTKEILEQNYEKMLSYRINDIGIFSASMNEKTIGRITFATIGTIIKHKDIFRSFGLVIVDECHRVNSKGGQYEEFISHLNLPTIGLTATPYRMRNYRDFKTGLPTAESRILTRTRPRIFSKIIHITQLDELFEEGYLCPASYICYDDYDSKQIRSTSTEQGFDDKALEAYNQKLAVADKMIHEIEVCERKHLLAFTPFVSESERVIERRQSKNASVS